MPGASSSKDLSNIDFERKSFLKTPKARGVTKQYHKAIEI